MLFGAFSLPVRGRRSRSELGSTDGSNRLKVTGRSTGLGCGAWCDLIVQIEHSGNEVGRDSGDARQDRGPCTAGAGRAARPPGPGARPALPGRSAHRSRRTKTHAPRFGGSHDVHASLSERQARAAARATGSNRGWRAGGRCQRNSVTSQPPLPPPSNIIVIVIWHGRSVHRVASIWTNGTNMS